MATYKMKAVDKNQEAACEEKKPRAWLIILLAMGMGAVLMWAAYSHGMNPLRYMIVLAGGMS